MITYPIKGIGGTIHGSNRGVLVGRECSYYMDHDRDSGTVQGVSLGHAHKHSNDSPGAFH